jgi:hypothetical protein
MKLPSEIRARVLEFLVCFDGALYQVNNINDYAIFSWCEEGSEGVETTKVPWSDQDKNQQFVNASQRNQIPVHLSILTVSTQM